MKSTRQFDLVEIFRDWLVAHNNKSLREALKAMDNYIMTPVPEALAKKRNQYEPALFSLSTTSCEYANSLNRPTHTLMSTHIA